PFAFSLSGVSTAKNGHTTVEMAMVPQKNDQDKEAGLETALKAADMFMMQAYIVCDGVEYDYNKSTTMNISVVDNKMHYKYTYEFDTDKKPEKIFFYPVNKRSESDFHWEIDPSSGVILKEAAVTQK
ncbi:MAG: hypothetical protein HGA86_07040, partial [Anaerolineaceae bacterium]|nr:hypothetical protein [Anaerolineaceae bacterium]